MKRIVYMLATVAFQAFVISCKPDKKEVAVVETPQEELLPEITLISDDVHYLIGEIENNPQMKRGKEWLLQNANSDSMRIDSVVLNPEVLTLMGKSNAEVKPRGYFPVFVTVNPIKDEGTFKEEVKVYGRFRQSPLVLTIEGTYVPKKE